MTGLDFLIAPMLIGVGVYSVIATSRNDATGCKGTGPCSDCSSLGCPDAPISGPRSRSVRISPGVECLSSAGQPRKTLKQVSTVRVG
jgi:hypothetical protein